MRWWKLPFSWLFGAAPMVAMVPAQEIRTRVFIFLVGILFILASMILAQWDGMEAADRAQKESI